MQLTSVTSGVGTATKSVCVCVWRQGYVALDTRWVPTGVKEILKSIQVAFVCVCVWGGLNPPAHVCLDFGNIIPIVQTYIPTNRTYREYSFFGVENWDLIQVSHHVLKWAK